MKNMIRQLGERVLGVLSGFDRLLFRGILRCVINPRGLNGYLFGANVRMADFKEHTQQVTQQLIDESLRYASENGREIKFLDSPQIRKKDVALEIARRDKITEGLICVLRCVEPCTTLRVCGNRKTKKIAIERRRTQCTHLYHYFQHPQFGFLHVRLQTWFPFTMQVCLNGRDWLARDLTKAGIRYRQHDNCIHWVHDLEAAHVRRPTRSLLDDGVARPGPTSPSRTRRFSPTAPRMRGTTTGRLRKANGPATFCSATRPMFCLCADVWPLTACACTAPQT